MDRIYIVKSDDMVPWEDTSRTWFMGTDREKALKIYNDLVKRVFDVKRRNNYESGYAIMEVSLISEENNTETFESREEEITRW